MADTPGENPCLICGPRTAVGLHVRFEPGPLAGEVEARTVVDARFSGFQGVVHGGIVAGLLDDAMWYTAFFHDGRVSMTAALEVRYRAPVPVGEPLVVRARLAQAKGRLATATAEVARAAAPDIPLATAAGRFLTVKDPAALVTPGWDPRNPGDG